MGNPVFRRSGAEVIAAAGAAPRIKVEGPTFAATVESVLGLAPGSVEAPGAPNVAVDAQTPLDLGGVRLRVIPVGDAGRSVHLLRRSRRHSLI
jgi:hypothetical protein